MIRPATKADLPGIADIWNPVIRDTFVTFNAQEKSEAELRAMMAQKEAAGHAFMVAMLGDRIAGFATYGQFRGGIGYARTMEHTVILAPWARGQGMGRDLMAAIESHARQGGAHSMFAGVSAANPEGRAFHARLGYAEVALLREVGFKAGRWLDLVLMQKLLD
ncbi:MAG: GNAT family N-acetyltransferase [Gemmobacter sp.]